MNYISVCVLSPKEDAYVNNIYDGYRAPGGGYDIIEREDEVFTLNGDCDAYTETFEYWSDIQKIASHLLIGKHWILALGLVNKYIAFIERV